jgi:predicted RNase H-like HicB family nuclease
MKPCPSSARGNPPEEALANAREAIVCYLEGLEKLNQIASTPGALLKELEVAL